MDADTILNVEIAKTVNKTLRRSLFILVFILRMLDFPKSYLCQATPHIKKCLIFSLSL